MYLNTPIRYIKGVGEKRAEFFGKLGIQTVEDILTYYPRAYEDWSNVIEISESIVGEIACIRAIVCFNAEKIRTRSGITMFTSAVTDGKSVMKITVFNNKFIANNLIEGREILLFGKIGGDLLTREMVNPMISPAQGGEKIRPVYSKTKELSNSIIERTVRIALDNSKDNIVETLPDYLRQKYALSSLAISLENIHFPTSQYNLRCARRRLIFEELLVLQLSMLLMKGKNKEKTGFIIETDYTDEFFKSLDFSVTNAQKKAVKDAMNDMMSGRPMNRLLQGDVGSGKTVVAAALIYNCAKNNIQSAIMAPTEILAIQHYNTLKKLMKSTEMEIVLLTGSNSAKEKRIIKEKLNLGEAILAVGTHALIQKDVEFKNLGLVITDEQHRFGVQQRSELTKKGKCPHIFVMSATPIPRTLALIIYGELDVSVLDEMPPGRQKTDTFSVNSSLRIRALNYVKKHVENGYQGYVVCPLVDDEENESSMMAAKQYALELQNGIFKNYNVGLLHGKMKPAEKEKVMQKFVHGEVQILVSTTVIEVGVDVPNAVVIVIENAERFGLSQLHQLRGRVGRGNIKSTCILISDAKNEEAQKRLNIMCETTDGFKIAQEDLQLRGPGDFFGSRQHGLPELKIASLLADTATMSEAQKAAAQIIKNDSKLKDRIHVNLKKSVLKMFKKEGSEEMGLGKILSGE